MFRMKDDGLSLQRKIQTFVYPWDKIAVPSVKLVTNLNRGGSKGDNLQTPSPKLEELLISRPK